jgi:hypothetical protein
MRRRPGSGSTGTSPTTVGPTSTTMKGAESVDLDAGAGDDLATPTPSSRSPTTPRSEPDGRWVGQLILHRLPAGRQLTVHVGGRSVTATVGVDGTIDVSALLDGEPFALLPHEGSVTVEDEHGNRHEVVVFAHASEDWFTAAIEQRDRPPRPRSAREVHELERLLATLQRFQQPTSSAPTPPAGGHAGPDDRLVLPLDRRFDLVAKFAAHYPLATDDEIRRYLGGRGGRPPLRGRPRHPNRTHRRDRRSASSVSSKRRSERPHGGQHDSITDAGSPPGVPRRPARRAPGTGREDHRHPPSRAGRARRTAPNPALRHVGYARRRAGLTYRNGQDGHRVGGSDPGRRR